MSLVELETGALSLGQKEEWINTHNLLLSYLLRCNTDVTSLLSGTMVKAVLAYVTDYVKKTSLKTYSVPEAIQMLIQGSAELVGGFATATS